MQTLEYTVDVSFKHNKSIRGIRWWIGIRFILIAQKLLKTKVNVEMRQK